MCEPTTAIPQARTNSLKEVKVANHPSGFVEYTTERTTAERLPSKVLPHIFFYPYSWVKRTGPDARGPTPTPSASAKSDSEVEFVIPRLHRQVTPSRKVVLDTVTLLIVH